MCGIVGVAGNLTANDVGKFKHMLEADVMRGRDATGIMAVDLKGNPSNFKLAYEANVYLNLPSTKNFLGSGIQNTVLLGHNRHATKGRSDAHENAHPFEHGHITMVHNGSLNSWHNVTPVGETYTVDSEAICRALELDGPEVVIPKLNGAFALVWYNSIEGTLNFVRNDERALALALDRKGNKAYWASESGMLKWILDRKYFGGVMPIDYDEIIEVPTGTVISIPVEGTNINLEEMTETKVDLYTVPTYQGWQGGKTHGGGGLITDEKYSTAATTAIEKAGRANDKIKEFVLSLDLNASAVILDERMGMFAIDFDKYNSVARTGTLKCKLIEAPHSIIEFHGVTESEWIHYQNNFKYLMTGFLSRIYVSAKTQDIVLVGDKDSLKKLDMQDLGNYEFDWENLPEFPECSEEQEKHFLNACCESWGFSLPEPKQEINKATLKDGSIAEVSSTVMLVGDHSILSSGTRYIVSKIEMLDSGKVMIGVVSGTTTFLLGIDQWTRAENVIELPGPEGDIPKESGCL